MSCKLLEIYYVFKLMHVTLDVVRNIPNDKKYKERILGRAKFSFD